MKLEISGLHFKYDFKKDFVIKDLSFTAESGSYWCLAGPNGCGKSTLLKLLCGFESVKPTAHSQSGKITWDDKSISNLTKLELGRKIAYVSGSFRPVFAITVYDFVLQARFAHHPLWQRASAHDHERVKFSLDQLGISHLKDRRITEISSGELQLVLIARAFTQEPSVLILDESTSHLDLGVQSKIFSLLSKWNDDGMTLFVVTHDLNLSSEFCPNMLWMKDGTARAHGPTREVLTQTLLDEFYGQAAAIKVGENPYTKRPKIFWA